MTVSELIENLEKYPKDMKIIIETNEYYKTFDEVTYIIQGEFKPTLSGNNDFLSKEDGAEEINALLFK